MGWGRNSLSPFPAPVPRTQKRVYATGRLIWRDGKLCLCDQHDGQVFMTLDCKIPTARCFQVVTDARTPVLASVTEREGGGD